MTQNQIAVEIKDTGDFKSQINDEFNGKRKMDFTDNFLVSIIIPLYNEHNTIKEVIEKIPNHQLYEIIIVDDGSKDNSIRKVQELKRSDVKIIKHKENRGYGAAVLTGIKHTTGDIIITLDSDGQHNPEEIPSLINPIINNHADIVVGSRYLGKSNYKIPLHVRVGEKFINITLWLLYHLKISNNQCGFRAFSRYSLKIFRDIRNTKFGLCTETLFKAASSNLKIVEIPISINARKYGQSHVNLIKIVRSIMTCIMMYGLKRFRFLNLVPKVILEEIKKKLK